MSRFGRRFRRGRELVVVGVKVDAGSRTATATVIPSAVVGRPPVIRLVRVDGRWRVARSGAAPGAG